MKNLLIITTLLSMLSLSAFAVDADTTPDGADFCSETNRDTKNVKTESSKDDDTSSATVEGNK